MDTSETYIKMCERAGEIQELRPNFNTWLEGDFYSAGHHSWVFHGITISPREARKHRDDGMIWLPRQDQLQEMVEWTNLTTLLAEVLDFAGYPESYERHPDPLIDTFVFKWDSMEQLWLAFVMKEKHNKVWNGEDWIKEE